MVGRAASRRRLGARYFRIRLPDGSSQMLAYYPREVRAQLRQFLDAYNAVLEHGRVPKVLHPLGRRRAAV